jgi:hypothetical protein
VQSDEVAFPCLLHQICHLLPPLCLIFLLSSYSNASKGGEAQSESEARELRASEAQRATRHKTRKGTKERLFCSRNSPLFGTEELDWQNQQGRPILPVELVRCIRYSIFSQSKSLVKKGQRFLLDTRGNTVPPWQPALTHVCPINK